MSAPPSGSGPLPDDLDDLDEPDDPDPSEEAASDPESARQEAEDALAEIEALADLDADPDIDDASASGEATTSDGGSASDPSSATEDDAEQAGDDVGPSKTARPEDQCENCGALLHGPYCSQCGQKAADRIVPVWHMINEALEAVFELDLRVLHTLPKFLFLPGRLTKEYINGRRKRYIRPFRLCLFATFLLFTVLAFTTTGGFGLFFPASAPAAASDTTAAPNTTAKAPTATPQSSASGPEASPDTAEGERHLRPREWLFGSQEKRVAIADSVRHELNAESADSQLERALSQNIPKAVEDPWGFAGTIIDRGPYLVFLMLPVFAFLLKLLYIRRGRLYAEHMIFSLHMHAFAFFALTAGILLEQSDVMWVNMVGPWVEASPLLYLVLSMAHVYDQGLIKSLFKAVILLSIYSVVLAVGIALLVVLALVLL